MFVKQGLNTLLTNSILTNEENSSIYLLTEDVDWDMDSVYDDIAAWGKVEVSSGGAWQTGTVMTWEGNVRKATFAELSYEVAISSQTFYGWMIVNGAQPYLLNIKMFDAPVTKSLGQFIHFTPFMTLGNVTP